MSDYASAAAMVADWVIGEYHKPMVGKSLIKQAVIIEEPSHVTRNSIRTSLSQETGRRAEKERAGL